MKKLAILIVIIFALTLSAAAADEGVLTLPSGTLTVGPEAFRGVTSANKVVVQEGAVTIGAGAFEDGQFSEIRLPGTITSIGAGAFRNCGKPSDPLRYYCIPDVAEVGEEAFAGCRAAIYIGNSLIPSLRYIVGDEGVTITGLEGYGSIKEAVIPDTIGGKPVVAIANYVFDGRGTLAQVTIPDTVASIGSYAFRNCRSLTSVRLPSALTEIGENAFQNCSSMALTSGQLPAGLSSIGAGAFRSCDLTGTVTVPSGVTAINAFTFENNRNLLQVSLPAGLETIGEKAFNDCYSLQTINIPATVTEIGTAAFRYNRALTAFTIPAAAGITSLPNDVFYNCTSLSSVTLPDALTSIGEYTFSYCTALKTINFPANLTAIGKDAFANSCVNQPGNHIFELPQGLETIGIGAFYKCGAGICVTRGHRLENVMRDNDWTFTYHDAHDFRFKYYGSTENGSQVWTLKLTGYVGAGGDIEIPAGPTVIGERAFYQNTLITGVTIPEGVVTVERWAFEECSNLTNLYLSDTVTAVLATAFKNCAKLTDVRFPAGLTTLGSDVFSGCCKGQEGVHYYDLPDGLTIFDSYTFYNCGAVLRVGHNTDVEEKILTVTEYIFTYPDQTDLRYRKSGDKRALWDYAGTQSPLILPDDCAAVRYDGFRDLVDGGLICSQLSDTDAALSAAGLNHTFPGHEDLRYRVIDGVLYVMGYAGSTAEIRIPEATDYIAAGWDEQIRAGAFVNLTTVTKAVIPEGITRINADAFSGCILLTDITLPSTLKSMDQKVFRYCGQNSTDVFYLTLPDNMEDLVGRGGGANTFEDFYGVLVCGKTSKTAALVSDRNYVYTTSTTGTEKDLRYRYEIYPSGDEPDRKVWLVGYEGTDSSVAIPEGIYGIRRYNNNTESSNWRTFHGDAFYGNTNVTEVVIPEGTEVIWDSAFLGCTNLTGITFPNSLQILKNHAFELCGSNSAENYYYMLPPDMTEIAGIGGAGWESFNRIKGTLVCAAESSTAYVLSAGNYNFALNGHHTDGLLYRYENKEIDGVTAQRLYVYDYTGSAAEVIIPGDVGVYGVSRTPPGGNDSWHPAFYQNKTLQRIVIPEGVVIIENRAFANCTALRSVTLPSTLKRLRDCAFENTGSSRFIVELPYGITEMSTNNGAGWATFNNSSAVLVAPRNSIVAGKLYEDWWVFYYTLENAEEGVGPVCRPNDDPDFKYNGNI